MGDLKVGDTQDREGKAENPRAIPQEDLRHEPPSESDPISQRNLQYAATSNGIAAKKETAERWIAGAVAEADPSGHSPQAAAIPSVGEMKESATSTAIPETFQAPTLSTVNQLLTLATQVGDPLTMTQERLGSAIDDPTLDSAHSIVDSEPQRIQGFAKLEFTDGEFYMNTYSVELGRDIRAARLAVERDLAHVQRNGAKRRKRSSSDGDTSEHAKWPNGRPISSSVVSESGGVIALDHSDIETTKRKRRSGGRRRTTKSTTSSSQQLSRKSSFVLPLIRTDYQSLAMESLMDSSLGHQYHDPHSSLPRPEACPLIPVHPPAAAEGARSGHKTISRKHIKIAFNFEKHCFEVKIMGRNGAFVDEHWYPEGDIRPLRSGSVIQIGGVLIRFVLPDLAIDGAVQDASGSVSGSSLGLDVEDGQEQNRSMEDSSGVNDDEDEEERNGYKDGDEEDEEDSNDNEKDCDKSTKAGADDKPAEGANRPARTRRPTKGKERSKATQHPKIRKTKGRKVQSPVKMDTQAEPSAPPPKRKGPGRPPKDGHMSQKERKRLRQQAEEAAKALEHGIVARPEGGKDKSIQLNGINQEDASRQPNGKRKYKKRKTKAEIEAEGREAARGSAEHGGSDPPKQNDARSTKPPKPVKPVKPPRSPSPEIDEASLTAEQLAKPQVSYVIIIHDVLTNSKTGPLTLPQIYHAIERKYPYFMFDKAATTTKGWQSSVRHNLSQHDAFRKIQREGKGWMWGLVPGVSIDKERKRRGTPPSMLQQPDQPPAPHTMQHSFHPQIPPPSANMHYPFFGGHVNLHHSQRPYQPPPPSQFAPVPNGFLMQLPGMRPQSPSPYQSPYGSAPPKASDPPNSSEDPQLHPSTPATNKKAPQDKAPETADSAPATPADSLNNPSTSQLPHPQQHPTPNVNVTAEKHKPSRSQDLLRAVERFKNALISSMPDDAHAESRVTSVISRTLGTTPEAGAPRGPPEDEEEKAIRMALENMIGKFEGRNGGQASDLPPPPSIQEQQQERKEESQKAKPGLSQGEGKGGGGEPTQLMKILEEVSRGEDGVVGLPPTSLGSMMGGDLVNGDVHRPRYSDAAAAAAMTETKTEGRDAQTKGSVTKRRWVEEDGDESAGAAEGTAAKEVRA
ncbi:MAG: hypothetical protein LQ342_002151 [Letrouitia transgressa]|nr:MAG: hypothetical protein LQ342_002151 [Letrouitia transgressa]